MSDLSTIWLILAAAAATYVTRIGGYVLITRMRTLPPRLEQGLNAVPAAVLTTLWARPCILHQWLGYAHSAHRRCPGQPALSGACHAGRRLGRRHGLAASHRTIVTGERWISPTFPAPARPVRRRDRSWAKAPWQYAHPRLAALAARRAADQH